MDLIRVRQRQAEQKASMYLMFGMSLAAVIVMGVLVHQLMWHPKDGGNRLLQTPPTPQKPGSPKVLTS